MSSIFGNRNIELDGGSRKKRSRKSKKGSRKGSRKSHRSNRNYDMYDDFTKDILRELDAHNQYNNLQQMANPMVNNLMTNPTFNPMVNSMGQDIDPASVDPLHLNYMLTPNEQSKTNDVKLGISYEQMMNVQTMPNALNNMSMGIGKLNKE